MKVLRVTLATMMLAALLGVAGWSELTASGALVPGQPESAQSRGGGPAKHGFEVWIADQSDTRPGYGGQILIYEGARAVPKASGECPAIRSTRSRRRGRGTLHGGDGPEPRAAAHDRVQQRALARGRLVRRQRPRRHLRRRVAHPAAVFPDHCGQHGNPSGACGLSGTGRLLHPGREPERQTAGAHRHELRDQHLHAQPRRHAGSGDVHHAQRQAVRAPGPPSDQLADLPDHRLQQHLRIRDVARRRTLRGRRDDHAHVHRRRVRQGDGARQRVRRHPGSRAHVHQLWRQSRQRVFGQSPSSRSVWFRRLPVSAVRVFGVQCARTAPRRCSS